MMSYEVMGQERVTHFSISYICSQKAVKFDTDVIYSPVHLPVMHELIAYITMHCLDRPVAAESHENYNSVGSYLDFRVESK